MTPTRPASPRSGSTGPPHGPHIPTNHQTADHTSLATRWRGGARCGARPCREFIRVIQNMETNSFDLVFLLGRPIQTSLVSGLSAEYCARRVRAFSCPSAAQRFKYEFKLIDLIKIKSQFIFNHKNNIFPRPTAPLLVFIDPAWLTQ